MGNYKGAEPLRTCVMVRNEHAALRLAHPTVIPDATDGDDEERKPSGEVDVTGSHPTVRAARAQGD